ncbi:MAG: efflux RND transporter periplasmic adaptor subunit [Acidobacteriota bacterium]
MRRLQVLRRFSPLSRSLVAISLAASAVAVAQGPPASPVRYTEAQLFGVRRTITLTGSVGSRRDSIVASEVEGLVEELVAREGDQIEKGQPVVRLRRQNLQLRLQAVQGQLDEARAREKLALTSLDRSRGLFDERIISQQQLDDASSEYEAWQGRVAQLEAEEARLRDDLDRATVRAPFSGVVVRERVSEGEWLAEGGAVVEMIDYTDLEVTVEVPENSYGGLQKGTSAQVVISSLDGLEVEGVVRAIVPRADSKARTFPVKVAIDNPGGRIAVGMLAKVFLPVGETIEAIIIPKDAVVEQGNQKFVYRIKDDQTAERINVTVGAPAGAWIVVGDALEAGDRVITRGNERVFPGQPVEPEKLEYALP